MQEKLTEFLTAVIKEAKEDPKPMGCHRFDLDDKLGVYVGWLNGYDPLDPSVIHAKDAPEWALCVGIKEHATYWAEYDALTTPVNDNGVPAFDDITVLDGDVPSMLARYLLKQYTLR